MNVTGVWLRQFSSFAAVGALGFAVDTAIFLMLNRYFSWPIHWARMVSALCSITVTWALNRRLTFADQKSSRKRAEYFRYLAVQTLGLTINLGTFAISLVLLPPLKSAPIIALAAGAAAAMAVNFASAKAIAFRRDAVP